MRILFVCLGNICRSPMAEGIFRNKVKEAGLSGVIHTDSAGTGDWHIDSPPDPRAQECVRTKGLDISDLRARQFKVGDFSAFDRIVVMDTKNHADVLRLAGTPKDRERVVFLLDYADSDTVKEVPDPYFGGPEGFEEVYNMIDEACTNLLEDLRKHLPS